jgi:hypothetical protein
MKACFVQGNKEKREMASPRNKMNASNEGSSLDMTINKPHTRFTDKTKHSPTNILARLNGSVASAMS